MKPNLLFVASALLLTTGSLLLTTGCSTTTSRNDKGASLTLVEPANQSITRGKTNGVMIAVKRSNFSGPVTIRFEGLPSGVSLVETNATIDASSNVVTFTLKADPDAAVVSNQAVRVVASGGDGLTATEGFKLTVNS